MTNFGPRHQPRLIARWDARRLPLESASVDTVVTNLPFGVKTDSDELPLLYTGVLAEVARVLRPGGRAVILSADRDLVMDGAAETKILHPQGLIHVTLQGRPAVANRFIRS